jgi:hypothetical protein
LILQQTKNYNTQADTPIRTHLYRPPSITVDNANAIANVKQESSSLMGFEDLGDALALDDDYTFLIKLFLGCAAAEYVILITVGK